jgi:hypothetical protein
MTEYFTSSKKRWLIRIDKNNYITVELNKTIMTKEGNKEKEGQYKKSNDIEPEYTRKEIHKQYRQSNDEEIEYDWRLAGLFVALSIGIFAFTADTPIVDRNCWLYANWFFLCLTFIFGGLRIYYFRKVISDKNQKLRDKYYLKEYPRRGLIKWIDKRFLDEKEYESFNKNFTFWSFIIMVISFILGVMCFVIYTFIPKATNCLYHSVY